MCSFLGTLSFGQVTEALDKNNVALTATAEGQLFNDPNTNEAGYEIPKGLGAHAIYNQSFWFGGLNVNGELRVAAERYNGPNDSDLFPGPYSSNSSYDDPNYLNKYDPSLWRVKLADIEAHINEYSANGTVSNPHPSILNWPGNGDASVGTASILAPFVDLNNDGLYDPYDGDYPEIKGCEALYIIMNDSKDSIGGTQTPSMNIEVHVMLYQYASTDFLNNITFIDLRVINRGTEDLYDAIMASYTDADLGNYADDYYGCDPVRNVFYTYNQDNLDEDFGFGGQGQGYGQNPPAIGVMFLNTPMTHAGYFTSTAASPQTDPISAAQYWNYMNGKWRFGDDWVFGGTGFPGSAGATGIPTDFIFPGANDPMHISTGGVSPGFEWSEEANYNPGGDRRMYGTCSLGTLAAGGEVMIHQAVVYGRDKTKSNFENVEEMLAVADLVQSFHDYGADICNDPFASIAPLENEVFSVFPNPSAGAFTVQIPQFSDELGIQIRDISGKLVMESSISSSETDFILDESQGVYFVTLRGNGYNGTVKLMLD